jgi:hypothetical protein
VEPKWTNKDLELVRLYDGLTEEQRAFISANWDHENGLEGWQERLRKKEQACRTRRVRAIALNSTIVLGFITLVTLGFLWQDYQDAKHSRNVLTDAYRIAKVDRRMERCLSVVYQLQPGDSALNPLP